jgi:hypothetical protein
VTADTLGRLRLQPALIGRTHIHGCALHFRRSALNTRGGLSGSSGKIIVNFFRQAVSNREIMKQLSSFAFFLGFSASLLAQPDSSNTVKVVGLASLPGRKPLAFVQIMGPPITLGPGMAMTSRQALQWLEHQRALREAALHGDAPTTTPVTLTVPGDVTAAMLEPGETKGSLEVLDIDLKAGAVKIKLDGGTRTLDFPPPSKLPGFRLRDLPASGALAFYAQLAKRVILAPSTLSARNVTMDASAGNPDEAARVLSAVLLEAGLKLVPDGSKFTLVFPVGEEAAVKPTSEKLVDPQAPATLGSLRFDKADLTQVLAIYEAITGRRQVQPDGRAAPLPAIKVTLDAGTVSLSRLEGLYAMETVLLLSGVRLEPVDQDGYRVVRVPKPFQGRLGSNLR